MSGLSRPLNNARLCEDPMPAEKYNRIPHIDTMRDVVAANTSAHAALLGVIAARGLGDLFSVHLVHKHFDIPKGRVMVLYFQATADGNMVAYEFTTAPGADLSDYTDLVKEFSDTAIRLGVQNIFALTAVSLCPKDKVLTEFEMAYVLSTVLVSDASWPPQDDIVASTTTNWFATLDYAQYSNRNVPGIVQLKCLQTRSNRHVNVTCSQTRNGTHIGYAPGPEANMPPTDDTIYIDGLAVAKGSEGYIIITSTLEIINSA